MSDIFTVTASVIALGASIVSGPLGSVDARPALDLHSQTDRGEIAVSYQGGELAGIIGKPSPTADYSDFPPIFFKALEAAEDGSFEQHMGVDPAGIARAGIDVVRGDESSGVGGSTLTQQLAKNVVTGASRSISRKLADMISAVETESVASKKEILESYANAVYFGRGSHGAKDAAQNWFGKDWSQLKLGEIAFLAGLVQAPSVLDPLKHRKAATDRRDYVLSRMADEGMISKTQDETAAAEPIDVVDPGKSASVSQAAIDDANFWALSYARRQIGKEKAADSGAQLPKAGEAMALSLDERTQKIAEDDLHKGLRQLRSALPDRPLGSVLDKGLTDLSDSDAVADAARALVPTLPDGAERVVVTGKAGGLERVDAGGDDAKKDKLKGIAVPDGASPGDVYVLLPGSKRLAGRPRVQGAAVVVDLASGRTLASVGGVQNWVSQFDRTQARRQPGSSVKPFLYLAALRQGYSPTEMISDAPVTMDVDGMDGTDVWSPDNYADEGTKGYLPLYVGLEKSLNRVAVRLVKQIGSEPFKEVLERAGAYPPGNDRLLFPSAALGTVETTPERMAHAVATLQADTSTLFDPTLLGEIDRMMRGVVVRGTAAGAFGKGPDGVIGKTGTSQQDRDAWFIGLTGDIALAVWVGRDDDEPLPSVHGRPSTGGAVAAPIVASIIRDLRQAGLSSAKIDVLPYGADDVASSYDDGYGGNDMSDDHSPDWYPPAPGGGRGRMPVGVPLSTARQGPRNLPPPGGVGLY